MAAFWKWTWNWRMDLELENGLGDWKMDWETGNGYGVLWSDVEKILGLKNISCINNHYLVI